MRIAFIVWGKILVDSNESGMHLQFVQFGYKNYLREIVFIRVVPHWYWNTTRYDNPK